MAALPEGCTRDSPAPAWSNVNTYQAPCAQINRPGKVGKSRREYRTTSDPVGPYKNLTGCTIYNEKKEACDKLKTDPRPSEMNLRGKTQQQLSAQMTQQNKCIKAIDNMMRCINPEFKDDGHRLERDHRRRDINVIELSLKKRKKQDDNVRETQTAMRTENLHTPIVKLFTIKNNQLEVVVPNGSKASARAHLQRLTETPGLSLDGEFSDILNDQNANLATLKDALKKLLIRWHLNGNNAGDNWKDIIKDAKTIEEQQEQDAAEERREIAGHLSEDLSILEIISAEVSGPFTLEYFKNDGAVIDTDEKRAAFLSRRLRNAGSRDKRKKTRKAKMKRKHKKTKKAKNAKKTKKRTRKALKKQTKKINQKH